MWSFAVLVALTFGIERDASGVAGVCSWRWNRLAHC